MTLKNRVDDLLKDKNRPLSWLAAEMGKTFDGLKLSLVKETIKYKDLLSMARILNVATGHFFETNTDASYLKDNPQMLISEEEVKYGDLKNNLKGCKEMVTALKDQLKDKERIISLLSKE